MRATEEAAFWLYSAKDWIDGMNAFVPDRLKAYALSMACEMLLKYRIYPRIQLVENYVNR